MKYELLSWLLKDKEHLKNVLCLWAGEWYECLLSASFWLNITAVDKQTSKNWLYPEYLKNHPKIEFLELDIREFLWNSKQKYDLITMFNVVHLLDRNYATNDLRIDFFNILNVNWLVLFSFFLPEDMMKNKFILEDFGFSDYFILIDTKQIIKEDDHPPLGIHNHYIEYCILKKRA